MLSTLREHTPGHLWLATYPVRYAGTRFDARMTLVRLDDDKLLLHSPGPIDDRARAEIEVHGEVAYILAPGNFHHFHVGRCQGLFPDAETWVCPGVERKQPALRIHGILGNEPEPGWAADLDQALVRGRFMAEVALLHRPSRTLILVDLIESYGDHTPGVHWLLRWYWKVLGMWNRPGPAPEYRVGWGDRNAAGAALQRILEWDFTRIVIAHGALVDVDAKGVAQRAWSKVLG